MDHKFGKQPHSDRHLTTDNHERGARNVGIFLHLDTGKCVLSKTKMKDHFVCILSNPLTNLFEVGTLSAFGTMFMPLFRLDRYGTCMVKAPP